MEGWIRPAGLVFAACALVEALGVGAQITSTSFGEPEALG